MTTMQEDFEAWFADRNNPDLHAYGEMECIVPKEDAYPIWQAAHLAGLRAMQSRVETVCDELEQHWSDYKDTALLNGNVALSNAASGEPRAARAIKAAVLALDLKP